MRSRLKSRLLVLLVVAIAAAPAIAALTWYLNADSWRPGDTVNHGRLISPPRQVSSAALPLLGGGQLPAGWFQHRWTLVYAGAPACPTRCKHALYNTRQIRLAEGAQMSRVQRLFITSDEPADAAGLRRAHPDLTVVEAGGPAGARFTRQFTAGAGNGPRIYIVDPLGRLIMSYPADADPANILADLKQLLKYSHIG